MKIETTSISEFEKIVSDLNSNIYIFGAGNFGKILGNFLNQKQIDWKCFLDNDPTSQKKKICGKNVCNLEKLDTNNKEKYIIVSVSKLKYADSYYEIIKSIENKGIDIDNILYFDDNYTLIEKITYYIKKPEVFLEKLKDLKNIYLGKKCFIIGNGPSLKIDDLEKISGYITMGCNTIIDLFDRTKWRPTCFCFEDSNYIKKYISDVNDLKFIALNCEMAFTGIDNKVYDEYRGIYENIYFLNRKRDVNALNFSEQIDHVIYGSGTTLYTLLQLAIYMGIKEIYLLGVDFIFKREIDEDNNLIINESVNNHMKLMNQIDEGLYHKKLIMKAFQRAKIYAEANGIKIYNATRGGALEVFERVNFEDIIFSE